MVIDVYAQRRFTRSPDHIATGWRQPEAVALYLAMGYTPPYDPSLPAEDIGLHPFEKQLLAEGES